MRNSTRVTLGVRMLCLGVVLGTTSCLGLSSGSRPAVFSGRWVDATRSTMADSLVWMLSPEGGALLDLSRRGDPATEAPDRRDSLAGPARRTRLYRGIWYVHVGPAGEHPEELCFMRPGREAETCSAYTIDTLAAGERRTLQLRLVPRPGGRQRAPRVLLRPLP